MPAVRDWRLRIGAGCAPPWTPSSPPKAACPPPPRSAAWPTSKGWPPAMRPSARCSWTAFAPSTRARARSGGAPSPTTTAAHQAECMAHLEKSDAPAGFVAALRDAVYEAYYSNPEVWKLDRLPVPLRSAPHGHAGAVRPATGRARARHGSPLPGDDLMRAEPADVVVIGAGAAGAALTWRLASQGARVVCLEQGDWHRPGAFASERDGLRGPTAPRQRDLLSQRPQAAGGLPDHHRRRRSRVHGHVERRRRQHRALGGSFPAPASVRLPRAPARRRRRGLADRVRRPGALLRPQRRQHRRVGLDRRSRQPAALAATDAAPAARPLRGSAGARLREAGLALVALRQRHPLARLRRAAPGATTAAGATSAVRCGPRRPPT